MKKIVIVAVVVILLSGIFGCDGNNSSSSSGSTLRPYLENGIYQINVSVDLKLSESIPDLPEFDTWLYGKMTLTKMEITDKYTRVYSSISVDSSSGFYFLGAPTEDDYLIDNLKNKYKASSYGESYKTFQFIERDRTYLGYVEYKGRPPYSGVDSFKYYMTGLEKPIQFSIKVPLIAVVEEASTPTEDLKQQLAEKFAPVLWLHPDEVYEPKEVGILINHAFVRNSSSDEVINLRDYPKDQRPEVLSSIRGTDWYLDFNGFSLEDGADSYKKAYQNVLAKGYKTTIYARVLQENGKTVVQYWLFYFFNDWTMNEHEGDWEQITLVFGESDLQSAYNSVPEIAAYSQHINILRATTGGTKRKWEDVYKLNGHPCVYVAKGSHANYFGADSFKIELPSLEWLDETSIAGVKIIPEELRNDMDRSGENYITYGTPIFLFDTIPWLLFEGRWGEWVNKTSLNNGPESPPQHKAWKNPLEWIDSLKIEKGP